MRPSISPLDLRKRLFAKRFRGYDIQEVTQFLETFADDLEELFRDIDELERENSRLKEENTRHRETESTLKETLLLAQRSAEGLRTSSEKDAERVVADAGRQADRLMQQALGQAGEVERKIRDLRLERKNFHLKLQGMIDLFQQILNFDKEDDDLEASLSVLRAKRRESGSA
jgi:cell division initiation protein